MDTHMKWKISTILLAIVCILETAAVIHLRNGREPRFTPVAGEPMLRFDNQKILVCYAGPPGLANVPSKRALELAPGQRELPAPDELPICEDLK
jgi:hypothetical protein